MEQYYNPILLAIIIGLIVWIWQRHTKRTDATADKLDVVLGKILELSKEDTAISKMFMAELEHVHGRQERSDIRIEKLFKLHDKDTKRIDKLEDK